MTIHKWSKWCAKMIWLLLGSSKANTGFGTQLEQGYQKVTEIVCSETRDRDKKQRRIFFHHIIRNASMMGTLYYIISLQEIMKLSLHSSIKQKRWSHFILKAPNNFTLMTELNVISLQNFFIDLISKISSTERNEISYLWNWRWNGSTEGRSTVKAFFV